MRAVLDACVLVPPLMRGLLLAAAARGHLVPLWSPRILEEWARAAARDGRAAEILAREEIARLTARWPEAMTGAGPEAEAAQAVAGLVLPDPDDLHVLVACVAGRADLLITRNHRDFPSRVLSRLGVSRADPDPLLARLAGEDEGLRDAMRALVAEAASELPLRMALKRSALPRLGRLMQQG